MQLKSRMTALIAAGLLIVGGVAMVGGVAVANNGDDEELTGTTRDRAVEAALAHTGGGTVTETEIGDDGAAYEVEIRLDDGSQVEVHLDENFVVTGDEPDDDGPNGEDDDDGDDD